MTDRAPARSPAALAAALGLTLPQLAQQLARVTQAEGLSAAGLTLGGVHLSAAEVLGVLAQCPPSAPAPLPACPVCDGQGEFWGVPYENPRECSACGGTGSAGGQP